MTIRNRPKVTRRIRARDFRNQCDNCNIPASEKFPITEEILNSLNYITAVSKDTSIVLVSILKDLLQSNKFPMNLKADKPLNMCIPSSSNNLKKIVFLSPKKEEPERFPIRRRCEEMNNHRRTVKVTF